MPSGVENRIRLRCEVKRSNAARHRTYSLPFFQSFPPLPFCPRFIQLPLKRIFRKPANFFPESNQLFVGHFAQFIPQLPQNSFVRLETDCHCRSGRSETGGRNTTSVLAFCRADSFGPAIRAGTVLDFNLHLQIDRSADTLYRIPHDYEILSKTPVYIVGKAIYSLAQMHRSTAQHKRGPRKAPALSVPRLGKIRKLLQILRRAKTPKVRQNTLFSDADTLATLHDSRSLDQISLLDCRGTSPFGACYPVYNPANGERTWAARRNQNTNCRKKSALSFNARQI